MEYDFWIDLNRLNSRDSLPCFQPYPGKFYCSGDQFNLKK